LSEEQIQSTFQESRRGYGNLIGLFVAMLILLLAGHAYFEYTTDDSYISFRYARNLAEGNGLVWNPGERLESYSNFLWVVLLSLAHTIGLNIVFTAKILGILSGIGILILSYWLARELGRPKVSPYLWIAPILLVYNRDFLFWMGSGMETAFYAFLVLAAICRYFIEIRTNDRKPISAILFFLVAITRPEGLCSTWRLLCTTSVTFEDTHGVPIWFSSFSWRHTMSGGLSISGMFCRARITRRSVAMSGSVPGWNISRITLSSICHSWRFFLCCCCFRPGIQGSAFTCSG